MQIGILLLGLTQNQAASIISQFGSQAQVIEGTSAPAAGGNPPPPAPAAGGNPPPPAPAAGGNAPPPAPAPAPAPAASNPPPPPPAQQTQPDPNNLMARVLEAMNGYAQVHQAAGAKKVLQQCSLNRVQDASPAQLEWLLGAFSNHAYVPQ